MSKKGDGGVNKVQTNLSNDVKVGYRSHLRMGPRVDSDIVALVESVLEDLRVGKNVDTNHEMRRLFVMLKHKIIQGHTVLIFKRDKYPKKGDVPEWRTRCLTGRGPSSKEVPR
jgi:hypothetical protein